MKIQGSSTNIRLVICLERNMLVHEVKSHVSIFKTDYISKVTIMSEIFYWFYFLGLGLINFQWISFPLIWSRSCPEKAFGSVSLPFRRSIFRFSMFLISLEKVWTAPITIDIAIFIFNSAILMNMNCVFGSCF